MNASKRLARVVEELVCRLKWYELERLLFSVGYRAILGLASEGREAIFGPVVTCAVLIDIHHSFVPLTTSGFEERCALVESLFPVLDVHVLEVTCNRINEVGNVDEVIRQSKLELLERICKRITSKLIVLSDWVAPQFECDALYIIRGSEYVYSLALATLFSRTLREKAVLQLLDRNPQWSVYGLKENLGHQSKTHSLALTKFGVTPQHRYFVKV